MDLLYVTGVVSVFVEVFEIFIWVFITVGRELTSFWLLFFLLFSTLIQISNINISLTVKPLNSNIIRCNMSRHPLPSIFFPLSCFLLVLFFLLIFCRARRHRRIHTHAYVAIALLRNRRILIHTRTLLLLSLNSNKPLNKVLLCLSHFLLRNLTRFRLLHF